jgi:hypothetical protein
MPTRARPPEMVTLGEELSEALWAVARETPSTTLAVLALAVLRVVRAFLPRLLAAVVRANQRTLDPRFTAASVGCPRCGGASRRHDWRQRHLQTVCGICRFTRPWYVCRNRACQHGFSPTDTALGIVPYQAVSGELQAWLSEAGGRLDFREAALCLAEWAGIAVSPETVRQHTGQVGARLEAEQQAWIAALADPRRAAAVQSGDPAPGELVVETDGVFVRYREGAARVWHEVKLGVVGGWVTGRGLLQASYVAAREAVGVFGTRLAAEAARRGALDVVTWQGGRTAPGMARLRHVLILGDAAAWIWTLAAEWFAERTEIVDLWHAVEHLGAVAQAVFGADTPQAATWLATQRTVLCTQGPLPILEALRALLPATPEATQVRRRELAYFRTHQARMQYPAWHDRGWPIGSGAVEGSAKHLVQARLKRPGCTWSEAGAHAVLAVRCHLLARLPAAACLP